MKVAVIDVGKTNAKLALVDLDTLDEIAVITRPNKVIDTAPYPHFDLEGHWDFFVAGLGRFQSEFGIDAVSVTTHGASATLIGHDGQPLPMLDYECTGPDALAAEYDAIRPDVTLTGSPRLPMGLNVGAQLHWLFETDKTLKSRVKWIVTYPQYWGYRLTGAVATDVTSLGCHTDLWIPSEGRFSDLVDTLGIRDLMAAPRKSSEVLGTVSPEVAALTGLAADTPVVCGIHDSNASLYPHVLSQGGAFSVVSTGTWVIAMAMRGDTVTLDPARDTLVNVNALGEPVPSARFMGGREYELIRKGRDITPTEDDRKAVLEGIFLTPSVEPSSGPFMGRKAAWIGKAMTEGQEMVALAYYLALMTDVCLSMIGAKGLTIVEGPFGRNPDYLDMLATLQSGGIAVSGSATGTSIGSALLLADRYEGPKLRRHEPRDGLADYAAKWKAAV